MTNGDNPYGDSWQEFLQRCSQFWTNAAKAPQQPDPEAIGRQFFDMWSEYWQKTAASAGAAGATSRSAGTWAEHLGNMAQELMKAVSPDAVTDMQNKVMEQTRAWQEQSSKAWREQGEKMGQHSSGATSGISEMALRSLNLPSREQFERLMQRLADMDGRLEDIEDDVRQVLRRMRANRRDPGEDRDGVDAEG